MSKPRSASGLPPAGGAAARLALHLFHYASRSAGFFPQPIRAGSVHGQGVKR